MGSVSDIIGELRGQAQKGLLRTSSSECSAACVFTDKNDVDENDYAKVYSSAIRHMSSGFAFHKIITDAQGVAVDYVFVEVNSAFEKLTGLKRNDIIGKKVTEVLKGIEHDPADWIGRYGDVALHDKTVSFESYSQSLNRWYQVTAFSPVAGFFVTVFNDVSLGKNTKKLLDKKTSDFESIVTSLPGTAWQVDKNLVFTSSRGGGLDAMGLKQDEVVGMSLFQFFSTQDSSHPVIQNHMQALSGKTVEYEYTHNNSVYWAVLKPLYDVSGVVSGVSGLALDVTERKNTEQSLKESMQRYKVLFDSSPDSIAEVDEKGNCLAANQRMAKNLGVSVETLVGKNLSTVLLKEIAEQRGNVLKKVLEDGKIQVVEDERAGKHFYNTYVPIRHSDGTKTVQVIARDVSEQKKAEEALKESEEKYKRLFESSPDLILESDEEGHILAINPMMAKSIGIPVEKIIGKNIFDILPRDIAEHRAKIGRKALEEMKNQEFEDERMGRNFHSIYVPIVHSDGKKTTQLIVRDITEQKQAEKAIMESEEKFRDLFENASDLIQSVDINGRFLYVNKKWLRTLGYTEDEAKNLTFPEILRKDQISHCMELIKEIYCGKSFDNIETVYVSKDGREIYVRGNANARFEDGKFVATRGIFRDVTEEKITKTALIESEEKYRSLYEYSQDAIMTIAPPHWLFTSGNPATIKLFNAKNEQEFLTKGPYDVSPEFQPDGQPSNEKALEMINLALKNGSNFFEWTHKTLDGKEFPTTVLLTRVEIEKDKPFLQATVRDITKQKKSEEEIKKQIKNTTLLNTIISTGYKADNIKEYLSSTLDEVLDKLRFDAGGIYLVDEDEKTASVVCSKNIPDAFLNLVKKVSIDDNPLYKKLFRSGEMIVAEDYLKTDPEHAKISGYTSSVSIPICLEGVVIGALDVACFKKGSFEQAELEILQTVASQIGSIVGRLQKNKELRDNLEELKRWKKVTVGRELQMKELKEKIRKRDEVN